MRIRVIKLENVSGIRNPTGAKIGNRYEGHFVAAPLVGHCFYMDLGDDRVFRTSVVEEIIDYRTFRTANSIYYYETIM